MLSVMNKSPKYKEMNKIVNKYTCKKSTHEMYDRYSLNKTLSKLYHVASKIKPNAYEQCC